MRCAVFEKWVDEVGVSKAAELVSSECDDGERVSYQLIQHWVKKGVPPKHVLKVQAVTEINCTVLRPDIYGPEPDEAA